MYRGQNCQEAVRGILEAISNHIFWHVHTFRQIGIVMGHLSICTESHDVYSGAVLDVDIRKCFPSIPHEKLINILTNKIGDKGFCISSLN